MNCNLEGERFTILENIQNATNLENHFQRQILFFFITYGALLLVDVFSQTSFFGGEGHLDVVVLGLYNYML